MNGSCGVGLRLCALRREPYFFVLFENCSIILSVCINCCKLARWLGLCTPLRSHPCWLLDAVASLHSRMHGIYAIFKICLWISESIKSVFKSYALSSHPRTQPNGSTDFQVQNVMTDDEWKESTRARYVKLKKQMLINHNVYGFGAESRNEK